MSVARTRPKKRTAPISAPRRPPVRRTIGHPRSLRNPFMLFVLAAAGLIILIAVGARGLAPGGEVSAPPGAVFMQYSAVTGDTPASVASAYALDPLDIVSASGVATTESEIPSGAGIRVDASRLWARISSGPTAANEALVEATARKLGVEPSLAVAVAWQESRLDQSARSSTGAVGIMQVEPDTGTLAARDLGVSIDTRLAGDNVLAGLFWLRSLLRSYGGDRAQALAAYYEGPGNLARHGYLKGTAEYVAHAQQLRQALLLSAPRLRS